MEDMFRQKMSPYWPYFYIKSTKARHVSAYKILLNPSIVHPIEFQGIEENSSFYYIPKQWLTLNLSLKT